MSSLQFSYTLTEEEIYRGLRLSGIYKLTGKRALIESILLGVFFLFFFISFLIDQGTFDLVMSLVCAVLLAVMNLVPHLDMKRQAKKGIRDVKLRIYQNKFYIDTKTGSQGVDLDGSAAIKTVGRQKDGQLLTAVLPEGGLLILPLRAIPKEIRGQALSILLQGGQTGS